MIEIIAPPPAAWPERITFRHQASGVLVERGNLIAGSFTVTDWTATLTGIIAALGVLGYAVTEQSGECVVFTRHDPAEGWSDAEAGWPIGALAATNES